MSTQTPTFDLVGTRLAYSAEGIRKGSEAGGLSARHSVAWPTCNVGDYGQSSGSRKTAVLIKSRGALGRLVGRPGSKGGA
jgi:hypothetical protein